MLESRSACPRCGEPLNRRPYLMEVREDAASILGVFRGEAGSSLQVIARVGSVLIAALLLAGVMSL